MTGKQPPAKYLNFARSIVALILQATIALFTINAQTGYYEKIFTVENGLPHNNVLSITSDKTGFLWIGTWDGLSRFDGYEFHNYHHDPNDSTTIPYFICPKICVDRYNHVWIFHVNNLLSRYKRNSDSFINYGNNNDPVLRRTGIRYIATDNQGNLVVAGAGGIAVFDSVTGSFKEINVYKNDKLSIALNFSQIVFDNDGYLWLWDDTNFFRALFSAESLSVKIIDSISFRLNDAIYPKPSNSFIEFELTIFPDHSAWMFSNRGLQKIPSGIFASSPPSDKPENIEYRWYRTREKIEVFTARENIGIELKPDEAPQTLFMDRAGTIWYSTLYNSGMGTGLHRYNRTPGYFRHYLPEIDGMPSVVHAIVKDDEGNLLIGADAANYITCISKEGVIKQVNTMSTEKARLFQHPRSMLPVRGGILVGYMKGRLDFYDYKTRAFRNVCLTDDPPYIREPYGFRSLYAKPDGRILTGTMGLYEVNINEPSEFRLIWQSDPPGAGIYCITADSSGYIWAGTGSRILKLDADFQLETVYSVSNTVYNIEDIYADNDGKLWLALLGGGILRFNLETGAKKFYTTADGLSNNTTYSILKDRQHNLWISTDNGISRFNTGTGKFRIFGPTEGLMIHEFNSDAAFTDQDGRMFFGGMGGVVSFHPDSVNDADAADNGKPLVITEFRVSGVPRYFDDPLYENGKIILTKGDDNFGVTFACLDLKNAEKLKYRYRISGYHEEWTETDHLHRSISITGLKPSTYLLEIQSSDIFGEWDRELKLQIKIPPMFHQTKAFSIIMSLLGIAIIAMFIVFNNRQVRIKEKQKQQYLKLESIRGQLNPHFIFNSLNSINFFIANNDRLAANRYIANFSKLIRSFLSNMSQEYISLTDEIASIEDYLRLEYLRFSDKFEYSVSVEQLASPEKWEVFPGMVQPFIENAIWHGVRGLQDRKGFIRIVFRENGGIHCTISDDGIGRRMAAKIKNYHERKRSKGIGLIMERMQLINRLENKNFTISVEDLYPDREECGTFIEIEIPSRITQLT